MLREEATYANAIIGLTLSGTERTIYRTRDEHANHYITDAVMGSFVNLITILNRIMYKSLNDC